MTPKKEAFEAHARRAAKAVHWIASLMLLLPIALILLLAGGAFTKLSSLWIGIPTIALGLAILGYLVWFTFAGRKRLLTRPICGTCGHFKRRRWDYYFHCPQCSRSASTGVGVPGHNSSAS